MKITRLFTGVDEHSYFEEIETGVETQHPLGGYSKMNPVKELFFREFQPGAVFERHNAPRTQYIIYLKGEVEVETSKGDKRVFKAGDVLLADDLKGHGHTTRTLTEGQSIIVAVDQ